MPDRRGRPCVAVIDTNDDILDLVRQRLEDEGFAVVTERVAHLKDGRLDLAAFVEAHDPGVIVYDIAPPYEHNWAFLKVVQTSEPARGRPFVITTTNKAALERFVGPTGAHEILGKPFDLDEVAAAVRRALGPRTSTPGGDAARGAGSAGERRG
jgi:DNA-binding NtrC family response regulator